MKEEAKLANEHIDAINKDKKQPCTDKCENYQKAFGHRDRACVLSDVYSVKRGELCSIFQDTVVEKGLIDE